MKRFTLVAAWLDLIHFPPPHILLRGRSMRSSISGSPLDRSAWNTVGTKASICLRKGTTIQTNMFPGPSLANDLCVTLNMVLGLFGSRCPHLYNEDNTTYSPGWWGFNEIVCAKFSSKHVVGAPSIVASDCNTDSNNTDNNKLCHC